jgi:SET domain-containing protein
MVSDKISAASVKPAIRFPVTSGPSTIDGTGAFAAARVPARRKLGELSGEIIPLAEARRRAKQRQRISIVEFADGMALDAAEGNPLKFINHSCSPNLFIRVVYHHVEFYTLRALQKGEELTCNYGETHHDGKLACRCGSPQCRGAL